MAPPKSEVSGVVAMVMLAVVAISGAKAFGVKLQVAPAGKPVQLSVTCESKLFSGVRVRFVWPELPEVMVIALWAMASVKSGEAADGGAGATTVRAMDGEVDVASFASPL
jgi:hypothetical protein